MPNIRKKFLHCIMLCVLSPVFAAQAEAVTITNLDDLPHNFTLIVAGEERSISLMPYKKWHTHAYPVRVQYEGYRSPVLERFGRYAVWPGGKLALQNRAHAGRGSR